MLDCLLSSFRTFWYFSQLLDHFILIAKCSIYYNFFEMVKNTIIIHMWNIRSDPSKFSHLEIHIFCYFKFFKFCHRRNGFLMSKTLAVPFFRYKVAFHLYLSKLDFINQFYFRMTSLVRLSLGTRTGYWKPTRRGTDETQD